MDHSSKLSGGLLFGGLVLLLGVASSRELGNPWRSVGPFGGWVTALTSAGENGDALYAVADATSLFRSSDGGRHWSRLPATSSRGPLRFRWLEGGPGSADRLLGIAERNRLVLSRDGGRTFEVQPREAWGLSADPGQPGMFYLTGSGALWRTRDGGDTWQRLSLPSELPAVTVKAGTDVVLTALDGALLRSVDHGESFQVVPDAPPYLEAIISDERGEVFLGLEAGPIGEPVYDLRLRRIFL